MSSWSSSFSGFDDISSQSSEVDISRFESALASFYIHKFFSIFGRAPVVPRSLL
jgi:hypothetical protein